MTDVTDILILEKFAKCVRKAALPLVICNLVISLEYKYTTKSTGILINAILVLVNVYLAP